jgi:hypothetical protein
MINRNFKIGFDILSAKYKDILKRGIRQCQDLVG